MTAHLGRPGAPDGGGSHVARTVLPGGLRVITESLPAVRSAAFGIWAGVGSRDEDLAYAGATHYLEHLLFKGTSRRSALDISAAMDAVGGELNAFTAKEYTCYYARVLDADLPLAIDVLADMVTSSLIEPKDVDAERGVILEEIAMNDDDPADTVHEAFAVQLFGDTPLGRPILGTVDSINAITRDQIAEHYAARYKPQNLVVAAAGSLDHAEVVDLTRSAFGPVLTGDADPLPPRVPRAGRGLRAVRHRRAAGVARHRAGEPRPGVRRAVADRRPQVRARRAERRARRRDVVAAVPGGAGEARPGVLGVQLQLAARRLRDVGRVRGLPARQGRRGAVDLPGRDRQGDLGRADRRRAQPGQGPAARIDRTRSRGSLVPHEQARQGRTGLPRLEPVEEILAAISAVTHDDVREVAAAVLAQPKALAVVGPFDDAGAFTAALG